MTTFHLGLFCFFLKLCLKFRMNDHSGYEQYGLKNINEEKYFLLLVLLYFFIFFAGFLCLKKSD